MAHIASSCSSLGAEQAVNVAHDALRQGMTLHDVLAVVEKSADQVGASSVALARCFCASVPLWVVVLTVFVTRYPLDKMRRR